MTTKKENGETAREFLRESNAIEGVFDDDSLEEAEVAFEYLMSRDKMTAEVVKKTHKLLMVNQRTLRETQKGRYRTIPVYIGGREAMSASRIKSEISIWCEAMNSVNPTHGWELLHIIYEKVHPFVDGNGRTGRMFLNWHRRKILGEDILVIKNSEKQKYYQLFRN
jgi:Fic family protein